MDKSLAKIAKKHHLKLIVLFGSQASGKTRPLSDVDILVAPSKQLTDEQEDDLREELAKAFKISDEKLDLVSSYRAGGLLLTEALEKGKRLFGTSETMNIERVRAWKRFQDAEHFRKFRRRFLAAKIGKPKRP